MLSFTLRAGAAAGLIAMLLLAPGASRAANASVEIRDMAFAQPTLTVSVGDTVTWTNVDSMPHTVSAENGAFDSGNLDPGATFSFTFTEPGTYAYRCDYHSDMRATVIVQPAATDQAQTDASQPQTGTDQPDTALPAPANGVPMVAQVLIGLGLLVLAFGFIPPRVARRAVAPRTGGGWRR